MCVRHGSCVNAQNQPVADPSACTTEGCGTPVTVGPVGQQSCSECVRAGKYFATGHCAASFIELEVDGAICSATHGVAQGLVCCDSLAGGVGGSSYRAGTPTSDDGGGLHSIQMVGAGSIGGCDLSQLSMKCADTDPHSVSFCNSLCRQMAVSMAEDCTREGISLAADAVATNPCLR
jgi:hypothetical protein